MNIPDNTLKQKLSNVYFIWGNGKTTMANELNQRYGFFIYSTDNNRSKHIKNADPKFQPALCRNVPDVFALDPKDALKWEIEIVHDFTPMVIADLIQLAAQNKGVICEGDIDIDDIIQIVTNAVTISNYGSSYDFFDRPDQRHMLENIRNNPDLSDDEKEERIRNAYRIVNGGAENGENLKLEIPQETIKYGIKQIIRDDNSTIEQTADMIAEYFGLTHT
jgi:hypothetical protein